LGSKRPTFSSLPEDNRPKSKPRRPYARAAPCKTTVSASLLSTTAWGSGGEPASGRGCAFGDGRGSQTTSLSSGPIDPPRHVLGSVPSSVVVRTNRVVLDDADHPIPVRADWIGRAACAGVDSALFFPSKGEASDAAKALCAGCSVKTECLTFALEHDCQGVWGGTTQRERARLRRPPRLRKGRQ